jgi:hypothetical protein
MCNEEMPYEEFKMKAGELSVVWQFPGAPQCTNFPIEKFSSWKKCMGVMAYTIADKSDGRKPPTLQDINRSVQISVTNASKKFLTPPKI